MLTKRWIVCHLPDLVVHRNTVSCFVLQAVRMMKSMGWNEGEKLGSQANSSAGLLTPVVPHFQFNSAGLGLNQRTTGPSAPKRARVNPE